MKHQSKTSSTIPCTEKRSEYYTCNEWQDEVNRKGHLTKPQEAVHNENVKNFFQSSAQSKVNDGECNEKWSEYNTWVFKKKVDFSWILN